MFMFLACIVPTQVPFNLLRASRMFTFEPPPGVRSNLLRTFASVPSTRMAKVKLNDEKALYFSVCCGVCWYCLTMALLVSYFLMVDLLPKKV